MADVNRTRGRRGEGGSSDRGQLILVTGLAVAVTLVALVLLLNTVIYTQNLATRGPQVEDGEAVAFRNEVTEGVGATVDAENRAEYDDWNGVKTNVEDAVTRYDALHSRYAVERGIIADVEEGSLTSWTHGSLLRQTNSSRNFTNATGTADWTVAGNVESARNFRMTVSGENLSDGQSGAFRVELDDGATTWRVYVYNDTNDDIAVAVKNGSDPVEIACTVPGPEATIDLSSGTVNGKPCPRLVYATGVSAPYDVKFVNAGDVTGTYGVTVDVPPSAPGVTKSNFANPDADSSPRWSHAVYAVEVEIHFETPNLAFHTTVRIAPGEPE